MRIVVFLLIIGTCLAQCFGAADTEKWLSSKFEVKKVLAGNRFAIDFNGMEMAVELVHLKLRGGDKAEEAVKTLSALVLGKPVAVIPEEAMGLSAGGFQQVYVFFLDAASDKKIFVNAAMVEKGMADYVPGKTAKYDKFLGLLEEAAKVAPPDYLGNNDKYCSELHSKKYHKTSCKWATNMNGANRIVYENFETAEKAGKEPCQQCLYDRVKDLRTLASAAATAPAAAPPAADNAKKEEKKDSGEPAPAAAEPAVREKIVGALLGIKGDNFYYSPVSKKVAEAKDEDLIRFASLADAKKSGRKPDPGSLRLENPAMKQPAAGECIGRALPYLRPCLRTTESPTRLCEACLNRRTR